MDNPKERIGQITDEGIEWPQLTVSGMIWGRGQVPSTMSLGGTKFCVLDIWPVDNQAELIAELKSVVKGGAPKRTSKKADKEHEPDA